MRYVIVGAGAIGGVVGARLYSAGLDTTLVARGPHLDTLRARGLAVDTPAGRMVLPIPASDIGGVAWTKDTVVLMCVKSQQTRQALEQLSPLAPETVPVVSLQNGVANEVSILRHFPFVYGAIVLVPATHLEPGVVVQDAGPIPGVIDLGRYPSGSDVLSTTVASDLAAASFASRSVDDIMAWRYRKLIGNLRNSVEAIAAPGEAADKLARRAMQEGEEVLAAAGIGSVSAVEYQERLRAFSWDQAADRLGKTSTWQSLARGAGSIETDYLSGEIVLLGRLHGIRTPVNELLGREAAETARRGLAPGRLDATELLARLP